MFDNLRRKFMAKSNAPDNAGAPAETKKTPVKKAMSVEDRNDLNEKASTKYGILNAADMSEKQLKDEIAAIDKQAKDAKV